MAFAYIVAQHRRNASTKRDLKEQMKLKAELNEELEIDLYEFSFRLPSFQAGDTNLQTRTQLAVWLGKPRSEETKQLTVWNRDRELDITALTMEAFTMQFSSAKYCICPPGDQLIGTHIATAIHYGCVPVIFYDYCVLPFIDILDWSKFSVIVKEADAYRLKDVLQAIPSSQYKELQENIEKVRRHFEWNSPPKKYDAFHMGMSSCGCAVMLFPTQILI